ncbi:DgyrCDS6985 [Dimorphilus gyrociliatus]|uniref:DgyrCDS6985 n=1 Tax=Dimorphilus gyrociliatus TaxID=2664684 RepID=A0A7I8VSC4_9ANNE|nr:DgyrCDS6985 [Dimorphilus gyrociliatus]
MQNPPDSPRLPSPTSPCVEETSLLPDMGKNKDTLERRLQCRRSVNELVDQGIYPSLRIPPHYAAQQKQLQLAKTSDILKHKIQQRPDRQSLVQQHILEDFNVDPSLHGKQRQFIKARLQDNLSQHLVTRPGPLDLVRDRILPAEKELQDALARNEEYTEEYSTEYTAEYTASPEEEYKDDNSFASLMKLQPDEFIGAKKDVTQYNLGNVSSNDGGGKMSTVRKNRDKNRQQKSTPRARVIKFHEYKGPTKKSPVRRRRPSFDSNSMKTSHSQRLQQQQMYLDFEQVSPCSPNSLMIKSLENLNVGELKAECRKRNIPVGRTKKELLEKLRLFSDEIMQENCNQQTRPSFGMDVENSTEINKDEMIAQLQQEIIELRKSVIEYKTKWERTEAQMLEERKKQSIRPKTTPQPVIAQIKIMSAVNGTNDPSSNLQLISQALQQAVGSNLIKDTSNRTIDNADITSGERSFTGLSQSNSGINLLPASETSPDASSPVSNHGIKTVENVCNLHRSSTEPLPLSHQDYFNQQMNNKQLSELLDVIKSDSTPLMEWNETQMANTDQNLSSQTKIPPNTIDLSDFRSPNENDGVFPFDNVIDFDLDATELNKFLG